MSTVTVDKGFAWAVPVGGFIANFIVGGLAKSYGIIMRATQELFDASAAPLTLAGGLIYAFMYCLSLVGIYLGQKYGGRKVVSIGACGCVLSFVGAFFSTSVTWWVIYIGGGVGISLAFIYSLIFVMIGRCFRKRVGIAMGISVAGVSVGQIAFPTIISYVIDKYGARGAYLVGAGIVSHFFLTAALMPRYIASEELDKKIRSDEKKRNNMERDSIEKMPLNDLNNGKLIPDEPKKPKKKSIWSTFSRINVVMLTLFISAKLFGDIGDIGVAISLPLYGETTIMLNNQEISLAIAVAGGVDLIARVFVGIISDQAWCRRSTLLTVTWLIEACNTALFIWFPSKACYYVFYGIFGLTSGTAITLMTVVLTDLVGQVNLPISFAIMMFALGLVITPGQFIVGYLNDITGNYVWSLWFLFINLFIATCFMSLEYPIKKFYFHTTMATDLGYCADQQSRAIDQPNSHDSKEENEELVSIHRIVNKDRNLRSRLSSISTLSNTDMREILTNILPDA